MDSLLTILACVTIGWTLASVLLAWAWSRWWRWLRGDFDR
jgi:hypothetical protein